VKDENGNEIVMGDWAKVRHFFKGSPHTGLCGKLAWIFPAMNVAEVDCPDCLRILAKNEPANATSKST
jgi:hypothetical protein